MNSAAFSRMTASDNLVQQPAGSERINSALSDTHVNNSSHADPFLLTPLGNHSKAPHQPVPVMGGAQSPVQRLDLSQIHLVDKSFFCRWEQRVVAAELDRSSSRPHPNRSKGWSRSQGLAEFPPPVEKPSNSLPAVTSLRTTNAEGWRQLDIHHRG